MEFKCKRHFLRSGPNVIQLPRLEHGMTQYLRHGFFLPDDKILNIVATFKKCNNNRVIKFLVFNFCNNCLFFEVSHNEIFDFLTSNSCF